MEIIIATIGTLDMIAPNRSGGQRLFGHVAPGLSNAYRPPVASAIVLINFAVDVMYAYLDPRIHYH